MRKLVATCALAALLLGANMDVGRSEDPPATPLTIKQVMTQAHKSGLLKKVADGKGTPEDAKKLLSLYEALAASKPPKGEAADWKAKTDAIVTEAKAVVAGEMGAGEKLTKAANCMACHAAHKPA